MTWKKRLTQWMTPMRVKVLFFATLRELTGAREDTLTLPDEDTTLQQLRSRISERYPALGDHLSAALAAINEEFAFAEDRVRDGDRVAFFPPVSGGHDYPTHLRLTAAPICHDELLRSISTPDTGAVCLFSGIVRGRTAHMDHHSITTSRETMSLEYEAYAPMAERKMGQVAAEIRARWPEVQGIAIVQRTGHLAVGQPTVLIACASAHRASGCFEAARYGIDRLKEIVPIWKKEFGSEGELWVEGSYQPQPADRQG